jgi:hypothetical protein
MKDYAKRDSRFIFNKQQKIDKINKRIKSDSFYIILSVIVFIIYIVAELQTIGGYYNV